MKRFLFFDTETNGLPKDYDAPITNLENWPRLVQLGWSLYDENQNKLEEKGYIIYPNNFSIPEEAVKVHGITQEKAKKFGVNIHDVLMEFKDKMILADHIVCHNLKFDLKIIGSEFVRDTVNFIEDQTKGICTMIESTDYCRIPTSWGAFKWPKLMELHVRLFEEEFKDAHDAVSDINATARCFFELIKRGVISI